MEQLQDTDFLHALHAILTFKGAGHAGISQRVVNYKEILSERERERMCISSHLPPPVHLFGLAACGHTTDLINTVVTHATDILNNYTTQHRKSF